MGLFSSMKLDSFECLFVEQLEDLYDAEQRLTKALPKMAEKMEQVLQRGTEIGAAHFRAFESERSQTHLAGERQAKRLARWGSIVKTAAEQAHRARLPSVRAGGGLSDVLASVNDYDLALFAHPDGHLPTLRELTSGAPGIGAGARRERLLVIVGPESGFTDAEVAQARTAGARAVSLGPRILRTETAALVMTAQLLFALEQPPVR